jgi:hypothetical protein
VQVWDGDSTCDNGCPWGDQDESATKAIIVVRADIAMQGLGEDDEESKGAFIALNDDDDDDNHTKDLDETGITGEDNVIAASLSAAGAPAVDGKVELLISAGTGNIKVWDSATKDNQILPRGTPVKYYKTWDISSFPSTVYVEGIGASSVRGAELKWSYIKVLDNDVNCTVHTDKVKITVVDVASIAVDTSDTKTHDIESVLPEAQIPDDHFVTAEGTGDITLKATISPSTEETKNVITWTGMTQDATDKLKATKSRGTSDKYPGTVNVSGATARSFTNWVVWSTLAGNVTAPSVIPMFSGVLRVGTQVGADYDCTATISPVTMFDTSKDVPDLQGPNSVSPPGNTNVCGTPLKGGANAKWDMSRRISRQMNVTANNPPLQLSCLDQNIAFPANPLVGNDDASTNDENNDPYTNPATLTSIDQPKRTFYLQGGNVGDTYENLSDFQEFARLELDSTWYLISGPESWSVQFRFIKTQVTEALWGVDANGDGDMLDDITEAMLGADTNGDGDQNDLVGYWEDNGSTSAN